MPKTVIATNFSFDHRWYRPEDKGDLRETMTTSLVTLEDGRMEKEEARVEDDLQSLISFKKAILADPNASLSAWTATNSENVCSWRGIRCKKGMLSESLASCSEIQLLDFRNNGSTGELPPYLRYFQDLRVLSVGYNKLQGHIPHWITNLRRLQVLDLSNNRFTGTIPPNLQNLEGFGKFGDPLIAGNTLDEEVVLTVEGRELTFPYVLQANTVLDLSSNFLSGEIPTSIESLSSLRLLNLSQNHFEGRIPISIGKLSTMEQLDLSSNKLTGRIPQQLSALSQLDYTNVSSNRLCYLRYLRVGRVGEGKRLGHGKTINQTLRSIPISTLETGRV
eukprot:Gb_04197 [translate_table: standard]